MQRMRYKVCAVPTTVYRHSRRFYSATKEGTTVTYTRSDESPKKKSSQTNGQVSTVKSDFNSIVLPHVPPTDNIPSKDVQTEGLFAGYRPLFLGNSSIPMYERPSLLSKFFTSFSNLKNGDSEEMDVQAVLQNLRRDADEGQDKTKSERDPIIPWDASISGMVYNDRPFRNIPNNVVSKLKPFKVARIDQMQNGKKNTKRKQSDLIKIKVHNSKVNDDLELVNLTVSGKNTSKHIQHSRYSNSSKEELAKCRHDYEYLLNSYIYTHRFLKADQRIFRTNVEKLNRFLSKEFQKLTMLTVNTELFKTMLPLSAYVHRSISSRKMLERFFRRRIYEHMSPLLSFISSKYNSVSQALGFTRKAHAKTNSIVWELVKILPSIHFRSPDTDCIISASPIPGFKRMHWLKPSKRKHIFSNNNKAIDYVFDIDREYCVTRNNIRYMKYPARLNWKTFDTVFTESDGYH